MKRFFSVLMLAFMLSVASAPVASASLIENTDVVSPDLDVAPKIPMPAPTTSWYCSLYSGWCQ